MNIQEIDKYRNTIYSYLTDKRIYEAIVLLKEMVALAADYSIEEEFNQAKTSYDYLLQYLIAGVEDNQREEILHDITNKLFTLTDKCVINLSANQSYDLFYTRVSSIQQKQLSVLINLYLEQENKLQLLNSVDKDERNNQAIISVEKEAEKTEIEIFNKIWCSYPLSNESVSEIKEFLSATKRSSISSLIVSSLFLSLSKFYDEKKLLLLMDIYVNTTHLDAQVRALTDVVITFLMYNQRVLSSKGIKQSLENMMEMPHFKADFISIINRLIRSRNTENITRKMREELIPGLMKMSPDVMDKIKNKSGSFDPTELEENPQWQEWLDKSGVSKKMEELNQMQIEGDDVFISTFSHLKSYPFFNILSNWFLPFAISHSSIAEKFNSNEIKFLTVIKNSPFLCDSDKYSFVFSMSSVPESQRSMMLSQFEAQNTGMKEMITEELPDNDKKSRDKAINRYIQDLYRFFKLFSRRKDFTSIFDTTMEVLNMPFISILIEKQSVSVIAEFYLKNGFFEDAIKYYKYLLDNFEDNEPHIYQKLGFAYQNMGKYPLAIKYYERFELANDSDLWNHRHLAACYRALKNYEKAIEYYQKAISIKPNNSSICLNIGHCLLETGKPEEALKYYFKADYLDSDNVKCWRAIAWSSFMSNHNEQSENYYHKLVNSGKAMQQDFLNYGHLLFSEGRLEEAVKQYVKSAMGGIEAFNQFVSSYTEDTQVLVKKGVDVLKIQLIKEAVIKQLKN